MLLAAADGCNAVLHPILYPALLNADDSMVYSALFFYPTLIVWAVRFKPKTEI
jgi:hypothetical protein